MPYEHFPELPDWFWYPITFMYGAIVGSFLNVIIYRLPLSLSLTHPASSCPRCGNKLRATDNVPLLGFLLLRGRCGFCETPISWRYFSVELVTACLWTALYHRISGNTGISWVDYVAQALFASVLVAMIFIDLDHFIAPDELNWVGIGLGVARDLVCLGLAFYAAGGAMGYTWQEYAPRFLYFGWLPRFIVGALTYGGILYLVSMAGFVAYARGENESLPSVLRRFFTLADLPEEIEASQKNAEAATTPAAATPPPSPSPTPTPIEAEAETARTWGTPVAKMLPTEHPAASESATEATVGAETEEEEDEGPPRLRLSPGMLAVLSAALLWTVMGPWALLALVVPVGAFVVLSRHPGETVGGTVVRFFRPASDEDYAGAPTAFPASLAPPDDATGVQPAEVDWDSLTPAERAAAAKADSDQFAKEAESGKFGGMGLGDVKLALAVGAVLGPALSLLSLMIATLVGAVTGVAIARAHGRSLRYGVPFVPFMAFGAIVAMLYGPAILDWYLGQFHADPPAPPAAVPAAVVRPRDPRPGP
jgi:prepilin signal peptidase PulO-like enzyme (type II secretory pathway)